MMAVAGQTMAPAVVAERVHQTPERVRERPAVLPALTGARFVAALAVVVYHARDSWGLLPLPAGSAWAALGTLMANAGHEAVTFFFLLSGFILAYTYLDASGRRRGTARAFYVARAARVLPAYLLGAALGLVPLLCWVHAAWTPLGKLGAVLSALTLTQGWFPGWDGALNTPAWSLSAEALFYALFPLLAAPLARVSDRRPGAALVVLYALTLAGPTLYLVAAGHGLLGGPHSAGAWSVAATAHPLVRLPAFALGVVLGRLFVRGVRLRHADVLAALACLALPAAMLLSADAPLPLRYDGLLLPLHAVLIYALAQAGGRRREARGDWGALLCGPRLLLLGEASYALYILHWPLHDWLAWLVPAPAGQGPAALAVWSAGYVALCCALCVLVLRHVEEPGRRALRRALAAGA